ncbi:MAG TPA: hypothetical protein VLH40_00315 [Atribacteraceae bacterium]|nr:hypothetical protein [Atribacteraceae bacterium]
MITEKNFWHLKNHPRQLEAIQGLRLKAPENQNCWIISAKLYVPAITAEGVG